MTEFIATAGEPQVDKVRGFKDLDLTQFDSERPRGLGILSDLLDRLSHFIMKRPWRKDCNVGMRLAAGRQLEAQIVEKTAQRIGYISHQCELTDSLLFPGRQSFPSGRLH